MKYPQDFDGKHAVAGEEVFKERSKAMTENNIYTFVGELRNYEGGSQVWTGDEWRHFSNKSVEQWNREQMDIIMGDIGKHAVAKRKYFADKRKAALSQSKVDSPAQKEGV